jgi:hypothetical protein
MPNLRPIDLRPLPAKTIPPQVQDAVRNGEPFRCRIDVRQPRPFASIIARLVISAEVVAVTCFGRPYMYVRAGQGSVRLRQRRLLGLGVDLDGEVGEATAYPVDEAPVIAALEAAAWLAEEGR